MGRMSELYLESAAERADAAEREVAYLRSEMLKAQEKLRAIRDALLLATNPNSVIATDLAIRIGDIAMDHYMGGKHGPA